MKLYLALLLTLLALPCYAAATIYPPIPVDGNGNPAATLVDAAGNVITDSGVRTISGVVLTADTPYTATNLAFDTAIAAATWDTFTLDRAYDLIYVSSDTDIIVALTYAEAAAGYGDVQYAGMTCPYPFRTQYVYIRTYTGLACTGRKISVRGMR